MDKERKKELMSQYKQTRPQMGIFIVRNNFNNKCHIQTTQDLRGVMNGAIARLSGGFHPYRELQQEVVAHGFGNFALEILETLPYDKDDEMKTDYSEELKLLQMIWEEKLSKQNMVFYKKRI